MENMHDKSINLPDPDTFTFDRVPQVRGVGPVRVDAMQGTQVLNIVRKNPPSPYQSGILLKICDADLRPQIVSVLQEGKSKNPAPFCRQFVMLYGLRRICRPC